MIVEVTEVTLLSTERGKDNPTPKQREEHNGSEGQLSITLNAVSNIIYGCE
jgi:hypothetical protein